MSNLELPENIKEDIKFIQENKSNPKYDLEHSLFQFAKLWAAYYEAYFNGKIYNDVYEPILANMKERINDPEFSLFLKYINVNKQENDLEKYLLNIRRLQFNYRWNRMKRKFPISVMSHLFICFYLSYAI